MRTTTVNAPTATQVRAAHLQKAFARRIDDIRADTRLSPDGKRQAMADAYLRAREELRQLQEKESEAVAKRRRALERSLFGLSVGSGDGATLSLRDAQQRVASSRTPAQALALLAAAERTGDDVLARAIVAHAWDRSWTKVLDAYAAERPGVLEKFHELDSLEGRQGVARRMATGMAFRLPLPSELRGAHSEVALRKWATA